MYKSKSNINIENSTCVKLPAVKVDNELNLNEHLDGIIKKTSRKVSALSRIFPFMDLTKRRWIHSSLHNSVTALLSQCVIVVPLTAK